MAILRVDDVKGLSRSFNDVRGVSVTTHGKATEVYLVYLVCSVTVTEHDGSSWVFCSRT